MNAAKELLQYEKIKMIAIDMFGESHIDLFTPGQVWIGNEINHPSTRTIRIFNPYESPADSQEVQGFYKPHMHPSTTSDKWTCVIKGEHIGYGEMKLSICDCVVNMLLSEGKSNE